MGHATSQPAPNGLFPLPVESSSMDVTPNIAMFPADVAPNKIIDNTKNKLSHKIISYIYIHVFIYNVMFRCGIEQGHGMSW